MFPPVFAYKVCLRGTCPRKHGSVTRLRFFRFPNGRFPFFDSLKRLRRFSVSLPPSFQSDFRFIQRNAGDRFDFGTVNGKAVHKAHIGCTVGSDGKGGIRHINFGNVGHIFLVLYSGKVEFRILNAVIFAAAKTSSP